jgi:N-acetyl-gamma-glutamyl-phosphate reductase
MKFLQEVNLPTHIKVIDLSNDFRLSATSFMGEREFIYGLPETNREYIRSAQNVANPGCFATAIQLGLLPLAKAGLLEEVHVTGITGLQVQVKVFPRPHILAGDQTIYRHTRL